MKWKMQKENSLCITNHWRQTNMYKIFLHIKLATFVYLWVMYRPLLFLYAFSNEMHIRIQKQYKLNLMDKTKKRGQHSVGMEGGWIWEDLEEGINMTKITFIWNNQRTNKTKIIT